MSAPKRIQRKRIAGWRMPECAVYVGRPSRWGNPFAVDFFGRDLAIALFANTARGMWIPSHLKERTDDQVHVAYTVHNYWLRRMGQHPIEVARSELAGRYLACWCPLDEPCHADVLLEIANAQ